jgi:hypothetical protein
MVFPNPSTQFKPGGKGGPGRPRKRRPVESLLIELYNRRFELANVNIDALRAFITRCDAGPIATKITDQSEPGGQPDQAAGGPRGGPSVGARDR